MSGVTDFEHYMNYPVCGYCNTAWDIVMQRMRAITPPGRWLDWCPCGGCDPDIWDFLDDDTGWPWDWPYDARTGRPVWSKIPKEIMAADNRCYHRRTDSGPNAPWRKNSEKLRKKSIERAEKRRNITASDIDWDEVEEEVRETVPPTPESSDEDIDWDD
jgi:hypothetical protein